MTEKDVLRLVTSMGQRKNPDSHEELDLPSRSDALPLSHSNFTVSEVYYKVHMTCVPCTATINDVNSVMFVNKIREMINFELDNELEKDIFRLFMSMRQRKNSKYLDYSRVFVA